MNNLLIIIIVILVFVLINKYKNIEGFISSPQNVMHAKFNYLGQVEYVDDKPPCYRGEYGCTRIKCPFKISDYPTICWYCEDTIEDPIDNP